MPTAPTPSNPDLLIAVEHDVVLARHGEERIGKVEVRHISFQWGRQAIVPMGGIAGVGTQARFRQQGIARRMMARAVAHSKARGELCSGVSTGAANVARRLYASAGLVYLFHMHNYVRQPRPQERVRAPGLWIRAYRPGDERALVELRRQTLGASFGCREQTAVGWLERRRDVLDAAPERVQIALCGERPVGYASCFGHWFGPACDMHVGACRDRSAAGQALLRALEGQLVRLNIPTARFSATEDETWLQRLLVEEGYQAQYPRVFQAGILDLQGLLDSLRPALQARLRGRGLAGWAGTLRLQTGGEQGAVELGAGAGRTELTLRAAQDTLTRVLAGRLPAWEAYLRGELRVEAAPAVDAQALLRALFPKIPCCHPIDEWW